VKIFLKSTILFALFGLMTCGGKSNDTLGPGDSGNLPGGMLLQINIANIPDREEGNRK
jgi:hypothetical protein